MPQPAIEPSPPALDVRAAAPRLWRFLVLSALLVATTLGLGLGLVDLLVQSRAAVLRGMVEARLEALASSRSESLEAWLEDHVARADRLAASPTIRLYLAEQLHAARDPQLAEALLQQRPYMRQVLDAFVDQQGLVAARLLGADGRTVVADRGGQGAAGSDDAGANPADEAGYQRLRRQGQRLLLDLVRPIAPPLELAEEADTAPVGAIATTIDATARLAALLEHRPTDLDGEESRLVVELPSGRTILARGAAEGQWIATADEGAGDPAGPATSLDATAAVPGTDWIVVQSIDEASAFATLAVFERAARLIGLAISLAAAVACCAVWWLREARHRRRLAEQYRKLAEQLAAANRLLRAITDHAAELVGLKDGAGRYRFVNPTFARHLAMPAGTVIGRTDLELFPRPVAEALEGNARAAVAGSVSPPLEIEGGDPARPVLLEVTQAPVPGDGGRIEGMVLIGRDVTERAVERRLREQLASQTCRAFMQAIGTVDPYLVGHAEAVREVALEIAKALGLPADHLATLGHAAELSQLGKVFLPRSLLAKPERHTAAEMALMRTHVDHTLRIIGAIDFALPVAAVLGEMHERLDGTGYPHGLSGDELLLPGRILAVADVFCARIRPRSYRRAEPAEAVVRHLLEQPGRYDSRVCQALAMLLPELGHLVTPAPGGPEPVAAIEAEPVGADIQATRHRPDDARVAGAMAVPVG